MYNWEIGKSWDSNGSSAVGTVALNIEIGFDLRDSVRFSDRIVDRRGALQWRVTGRRRENVSAII